MCVFQLQQGIGRPSVYHAVVVIFLEFFAWGLLTMPMLTVSNTVWWWEDVGHMFVTTSEQLNGLMQIVVNFKAGVSSSGARYAA